jgi:hypothetical protein
LKEGKGNEEEGRGGERRGEAGRGQEGREPVLCFAIPYVTQG